MELARKTKMMREVNGVLDGALHSLTGLADGTWKFMAAGVLGAAQFVLIPNDMRPVLGLFILVILDWVSAFIAAWKSAGSWRVIKSFKIQRTAGKLGAYAIVILALVQLGQLSEVLNIIPHIAYATIGLTEMVSILENINKMGYRTGLTRLIKSHELIKEQDNEDSTDS